MKGKEETSGRGSGKKWLKAVNNSVSDTSRRVKISARIDRPLVEAIEEQYDNRSEAIRKALRKEYGGGRV